MEQDTPTAGLSIPADADEVAAAPENALQIYCRLRPTQIGRTESEQDSMDDSDSEQDNPKAPAAAGVIELKSDTMLALRRPASFIEQRYAFEHVFASTSGQAEVYERAAAPLVEALLSGARPQDGLLFAYGATGSGKSYTIGGEPPDQPGIIPRLVDHLFGLVGDRLNGRYRIYPDSANYYLVSNRPSDQEASTEAAAQSSTEQFDMALCLSAAERKRYQQSILDWSKRARTHQPSPSHPLAPTAHHISSRRYSIFVSFVEVYNNYIYDLLEQPPPGSVVGWRRPPHQIRHDSRHVVYVVGASELEVRDAEQAMRLFLLGVHNRATAATQLNATSSRSHSIFTLKVVSYRDDQPQQQSQSRRLLDPNHLQVNQLAVVDLAGIERASRTKAVGAKLAEASNINNSLLTLRSCFEVMRQNQQSGARFKLVPYRQHRLTFLLKSYFEEGRAQIRMIVCLKPAVEDLDENLQVLSFGKKAKEITIEQYCPPPPAPQPLHSGDAQEQIELDQLDPQGILLAANENNNSSHSSSIVLDQIEVTLARFKYSEEKLTSVDFDRGEFLRELADFLADYEQNLDKIMRAFRKVVAQLSANLKHYPERQADRSSLVLAPYHLEMKTNFCRKLLALQRESARARQSSCLFGLTEIAGTPIIRARPSARALRTKALTKGSMVEEFARDLCIWESDSIDVAAKLTGQANALTAYALKQLGMAPQSNHFQTNATNKPTASDVFNRLYQQTPARYKFQPKIQKQQQKTLARALMYSNQKVAILKRFFTPEEALPSPLSKEAPPPHVWKVSSRIASLTNQLTGRDPYFVAKMAESVQWSNSGQASVKAMSVIKTALASHSSASAAADKTKRKLF